jgi:hypothetical protein
MKTQIRFGIIFVICSIALSGPITVRASEFMGKTVDIIFYIGKTYSKIRLYHAPDGRVFIIVGKACGVVIPFGSTEASVQKSDCKFGKNIKASYASSDRVSTLQYEQFSSNLKSSFALQSKINLSESGESCKIDDLKVSVNRRPASSLEIGSCIVKLGPPGS